MAVNFVYNYFFERHIPLRNEWLNDVIAYVQSSLRESLNDEALAAAVYEQWIHSEIGSSTEPSLSIPESARTSKRFTFNVNVVLQVTSLIDIGASLLSQFSKLTFEFEDNSGFDVGNESEKGGDTNNFNKPRRMLLIELTDGEETIKAIEYRPIKQLSLLSCPGCKVVVYGAVACRRNILLLTESNCCILGGDDEQLMKTQRPVQVMAEKLGRDLNKSNRNSTGNRKKPATGVSQNRISEKRRSSDGSTSQQQVALPNTNVVRRPRLSADRTQQHTPVASTSWLSARNTDENEARVCRQSTQRPVMQVKPLADRESVPGPSERYPISSPSSASTTTSKFRRSNIVMKRESPNLSERGDTPRSRNQIAPKRISETPSQHTPTQSQFDVKRVKLESTDDDVIIVDVKPFDSSNLSTPRSVCSNGSPRETSQRAMNSSQRSSAEDFIVQRYTNADIVSISDAVNATRYALGSIRRNIVGVMREVVTPLRIVDELWTMSIVLTDETHNRLQCLVAHCVLVQLIGLTPQEAVAIRKSEDKNRRREGTLRLKSVQESMERLDIVWEVEIYACGNSTPVVRNMQTLAQKFGLVR